MVHEATRSRCFGGASWDVRALEDDSCLTAFQITESTYQELREHSRGVCIHHADVGEADLATLGRPACDGYLLS